jgi:glycosyltransferase involved in cell wall biosynthesis
MRVVEAVFGVFHHFELARELERRGHLERVYSTWPWARLKREGLPHEKVQTFPWIHAPETVLNRSGLLPLWLGEEMGVQNALWFDEWTFRKMRRSEARCDAFIALAGAGLKTGKMVQERGGKFICDRGSTHQRFQERIVGEEFRRWGVELPVSDIRDTLREEKIYEQADAITVASHFAARSYLEYGIPAEKLHVIPYGVRLERFTPLPEGPAAGTFEVLFAGAVGLRKGVPYLLQAFAELRQPRKRLRVVGAVQKDIRGVLARLPQEHVEFLGALPQPELAKWMARSHVMVLPSIEEGLALVQAQALACGCPVICSTNTGGEDLFSDGVEGFVVPVRDAAAIAERMQRLADDRDLQQRMREAALRRVRSIGGWAEYGERWERLLLGMTGR